jgi:RND family efflux transporter MFP subunit
MSTRSTPNHALVVTKNGFRHSSQFSERNRAMPVSISQLGAFAAIALLPLLSACQDLTASAALTPERPVQVQRVSLEGQQATREFVGVVRARHETDLGFRVAGKIVARVVNVGDRVSAGDVVARLDAEDLRLQVQSAEAELAAAGSNVTQTAADFERYSTLKARGYASVAEFDRKKSAKDEAEGRLERARRTLDIARNQFAYAELKADADGVITSTLAEPGQVVAIGQPVARLAHQGEKEAVVALPETWLAEARQAKATVRLWSDPDRRWQARLRELSPQADAATRTFAARFTILDADDSVALGMTATVVLARNGEAPVARLPLGAVANRGTGPLVYVVDQNGTLARRPVAISSVTEDAVIVTSGVNAGDQVVTLGVHKLDPGTRVRVVEAR